MDIHKQTAILAGLRSSQQYRVWVEERKMFQAFILKLRENPNIPDDIKDDLGSLSRYFQKFPGAE